MGWHNHSLIYAIIFKHIWLAIKNTFEIASKQIAGQTSKGFYFLFPFLARMDFNYKM